MLSKPVVRLFFKIMPKLIKEFVFKIDVLLKRKVAGEGVNSGAMVVTRDYAARIHDKKTNIDYLYLLNENVKIPIPEGAIAAITPKGRRVVEIYSPKKGVYHFIKQSFEDKPTQTIESLELWETSLRDRVKEQMKKTTFWTELKPFAYMITFALAIGIILYFGFTYGLSQGYNLLHSFLNAYTKGIQVNVTLVCEGDSCDIFAQDQPITPTPSAP